MRDLLDGVIPKDKLKTQKESIDSFNAIQQKFLRKLKTIIRNENLDIKESLNEIENLENEVIKECTLEDKNVILSISSVAKHSMVYWSENFNKWNTEFNSIDITEEINNGISTKSGNNYIDRYKHLPNGYYSYPDDVTVFVLVHDGQVFFRRCPPGTIYDRDKRSCVYPEQSSYWRIIVEADADGATAGAASALFVGIFGGPVGWGTFFASVLGAGAGGSIAAAV